MTVAKAGDYQLVAGRVFLDGNRYLQGDTVTLNDEQAQRLVKSGAVVPLRAKPGPKPKDHDEPKSE